MNIDFRDGLNPELRALLRQAGSGHWDDTLTPLTEGPAPLLRKRAAAAVMTDLGARFEGSNVANAFRLGVPYFLLAGRGDAPPLRAEDVLAGMHAIAEDKPIPSPRLGIAANPTEDTWRLLVSETGEATTRLRPPGMVVQKTTDPRIIRFPASYVFSAEALRAAKAAGMLVNKEKGVVELQWPAARDSEISKKVIPILAPQRAYRLSFMVGPNERTHPYIKWLRGWMDWRAKQGVGITTPAVALLKLRLVENGRLAAVLKSHSKNPMPEIISRWGLDEKETQLVNEFNLTRLVMEDPADLRQAEYNARMAKKGPKQLIVDAARPIMEVLA